MQFFTFGHLIYFLRVYTRYVLTCSIINMWTFLSLQSIPSYCKSYLSCLPCRKWGDLLSLLTNIMFYSLLLSFYKWSVLETRRILRNGISYHHPHNLTWPLFSSRFLLSLLILFTMLRSELSRMWCLYGLQKFGTKLNTPHSSSLFLNRLRVWNHKWSSGLL